ncbi:hypothetical protein DFJ73DRAFT_924419, partial [Zopfochytrium polystomum]
GVQQRRQQLTRKVHPGPRRHLQRLARRLPARDEPHLHPPHHPRHRRRLIVVVALLRPVRRGVLLPRQRLDRRLLRDLGHLRGNPVALCLHRRSKRRTRLQARRKGCRHRRPVCVLCRRWGEALARQVEWSPCCGCAGSCRVLVRPWRIGFFPFSTQQLLLFPFDLFVIGVQSSIILVFLLSFY